MKRPKKLSRAYREAMNAHGIYGNKWMLVSDGEVYITIINAVTGKKMKIDKLARAVTV